MPRRPPAERLGSPRCALVVGGSGGIGRAVVRLLAERGCETIVFTARSDPGAPALAAELSGAHTDVSTRRVDLADPAAWSAALDELVAENPFDLLINAAGITTDALALETRTEDFERQFAINVTAPWLAMRVLGREMVFRRGGRIINIGSIASDQNSAGRSAYGATKAALEALTRSFALELGRFGVRVNAVAPGFVDTGFLSGFDEAAKTRLVEGVPLGRIARAEDVAAAVRFLLEPAASYVHGATLRIDGGTSA